MRPLGRLIILILVVGLAVGGYRWWQATHGGKAGSGVNLPGLGSGDGGNGGSGDIEVLTTGTKQAWLQQEIDRYNSQHGGQPKVTLKLVESRQAMHDILAGKEHPAIWSPSSPVWIARLGEVWTQQHNGAQIADMSDGDTYRTFFKSPLVFITTREKARFLKPILGGPQPWSQVRQLSLGQRKTPWGTFSWSHADPLNASSGMLTMSLIISEYAQTHGGEGSLEDLTASRQFATYLTELERKFVVADTDGSSALEKAYVADPRSRDFITAYESAALQAVSENPDLVAIYPDPTANADQSAVVLHADWVSSEQTQGAQAFLKFLGGSDAVKDGLQSHFRPAVSGGSLSLSPQLANYAGLGFQESYTTIELPPYGALNEAASQWRVYVAHKPAQ
jgi:hypothetical protein